MDEKQQHIALQRFENGKLTETNDAVSPFLDGRSQHRVPSVAPVFQSPKQQCQWRGQGRAQKARESI